MEANIDKLGYEDSDFTILDSKDSSGNSNLKSHNKPGKLTGPKKFKTHPEYYIKIPGVTNPIGVVIQKSF